MAFLRFQPFRIAQQQTHLQTLPGRVLQQLLQAFARGSQVLDLCALEAQVDLFHPGLAQRRQFSSTLPWIEQRLAVPHIAGLGPLLRLRRLKRHGVYRQHHRGHPQRHDQQ
ncbi:hypothetical protein D3C81_1585070 [compost metagenome]